MVMDFFNFCVIFFRSFFGGNIRMVIDPLQQQGIEVKFSEVQFERIPSCKGPEHHNYVKFALYALVPYVL